MCAKNKTSLEAILGVSGKRMAEITTYLIVYLIENEQREEPPEQYFDFVRVFEGEEREYAFFQFGKMIGERDFIQGSNLPFLGGILHFFKRKWMEEEKLKDHNTFTSYVFNVLMESDMAALAEEDNGENIDFSDLKIEEDGEQLSTPENPL